VKYPLPNGRPFIDCPVHQCVVVLDDAGRIHTRCPACIGEARKARRLFSQRRYRARKRLEVVSATRGTEAS